MRVYFIAVQGDHPEHAHQLALDWATSVIGKALTRESVVRAWMEDMPDPTPETGDWINPATGKTTHPLPRPARSARHGSAVRQRLERRLMSEAEPRPPSLEGGLRHQLWCWLVADRIWGWKLLRKVRREVSERAARP